MRYDASQIRFLVAPVALRVVVVGFVLGTLNGAAVFLWVDKESAHHIGDLATAQAMITLFSCVFGWLLSALVVNAVNRLIQHILGSLLNRAEQVSERIETMKRALHVERSTQPAHLSNGHKARYFTSTCMYGYIFGLVVASALLFYAILYSQAYAGESLPGAVSWFTEGPYLYAALIAAFTISFLSITLIGASIARLWITISHQEKQVSDLETNISIQDIVDENTDMSDAVTIVNEQAMRLMGFREGVQHFSTR